MTDEERKSWNEYAAELQTTHDNNEKYFDRAATWLLLIMTLWTIVALKFLRYPISPLCILALAIAILSYFVNILYCNRHLRGMIQRICYTTESDDDLKIAVLKEVKHISDIVTTLNWCTVLSLFVCVLLSLL